MWYEIIILHRLSNFETKAELNQHDAKELELFTAAPMNPHIRYTFKRKRGYLPMYNITKIVITGGPCAGKSTAMTWIQDHFTKMGYKVLFIAETATELITGGVCPWTCKTNLHFQEQLARLQITKEQVYYNAAYEMPDEKILIVCDRGIPDGKAYLSDIDYTRMMQMLGTDEVTVRDKYDAVFSLVTAAKGATEFYTLANNVARTETPEQAIEKDDAIIAAWTGHPHFRVIDNSTDFHTKMMRLISEISSFLGEPEPYEIERKFLIHHPDVAMLETLPNCKRIEIMQTYLNAPDGDEVRVRQRGADGHFVYIKTTKRKISDIKRLEVEKRISQDEYLRLLMEADITKHPIRKTRYCLTWKNQYFEIDVYPFSKTHAIVEIELTNENDEIVFPDFLQVICEVTDDKRYKNAALAETLTFDLAGIDMSESDDAQWVYETGRDESELSSSSYLEYNVVRTANEAQAFELAREAGRNYIIRSRTINGIRETQWWDGRSQKWT